MKNLAIYLLILTSSYAQGQEIIFGDTAFIKSIQSKCSIIYDSKDKTDFLLTKINFYENAVSGTDLIVDSYENKINRIIAFTTTKNGLLGIEFYYWGGNLIMIYETMEYYEEDSPKGQIKNFKNIPYWESRFYIENNKLIAHQHSGRKGIGIDYKAKVEIENSKRILDFVKGHTSLN